MSNRKRSESRQWTKIYMFDTNGEKILLGKIRINQDLPEKSQIRQGVNGITELMSTYFMDKICEEAERLKADNERLKTENEQFKAR